MVSKDIYDFILRRLLVVARETDRPMHIHCAATKFSLAHSHPFDLWQLIEDHPHQSFVLIHGGQPWILEAATMASRLPNISLDISSIAPWGWSLVEWVLEMYLGMLSWTQVLYGSDGPGYDPESLWLTARLSRGALTRTLSRFVEREYIMPSEANIIGRAVLGENCRRLHGLPPGTVAAR
jgi:predicted TIM-barrel fold metal-dependent hydrolase